MGGLIELGGLLLSLAVKAAAKRAANDEAAALVIEQEGAQAAADWAHERGVLAAKFKANNAEADKNLNAP